MKKECYIKSSDTKDEIVKWVFARMLTWLSSKLSLDNNLLLQQVPLLKQIIWNNTALKDNYSWLIADLTRANNDFHSYFISNNKMKEVSSDINNYYKSLYREHLKRTWQAFWKEKPISKELIFDNNFLWKYSDEEMKMIKWQVDTMYNILKDSWYTVDEIMNYYSKQKWNAVDNILLHLNSTPEIDILQYAIDNWIELNKDSIKVHLKEYLNNNFKDLASKKHIDNFVEDLYWEWIFEWYKSVRKVLKEFRIISSFAKFSLTPALNTMYWLNAFILSNANFYAKKRWIDNIYSHKVVDTLLNDYNFLKSETRKTPTIEDKTDWLWESTFNNILDWFSAKTFWKIFSSDTANTINTWIKWWSQALVDVWLEKKVKRLAISQALSKNWINVKNIDEFDSILKTLDNDTLNQIRADASLYYNRFFTNSSLTVNNRDRFSRWFWYSYLQHYVTARSAEMIDWVRMLSRDIQNWKLASMKVWDYLNENQELKALTYWLLHSMTIWHYLNVYVNDSNQYSDDSQKWYAFSKNLSDHLWSFDALLLKRVLISPYEYTKVLYNYNKSTWQESDLWEYWQAAVYWMTSELIRSLFRELKIGNVLFWSIWAWLVWQDFDMIMKNLSVEYDKAVNWMWRFWAIPWYEKYWMKKNPELDDWIWFFLMWLDDFNPSIAWYSDMMKISNIVQMLDKGFINQNAVNMAYMPIVSSLLWKNTISSEVKYKKFLELRETDPIIKSLYNWNFNDAILKTNWQVDPNKTQKFYNELIQFDYWFKASKITEDWTSDIWDNLSKWKEELFVQQVMDKIWEKEFFKTLDISWYDLDKQWLRKMIMMAENEVKWSSRVILSYIAQQEYSKITEDINKSEWRFWKSDAKLSTTDKTSLQNYIIKKYYPDIASFDKESWFKLIEQRAEELEPWLFQISKSKQHYVNSLALLDYVQYSEWKKADPNINMLKNIYSVVWKYIQNPEDRVNIINYTMETLDTLPINEDVKTMMKVWNLLWNMDFASKMMRDNKFMEENSDSMYKFLDIMFWVNDELNNVWTKLAITDLNNDWKKSYDSNWFDNKYWKYQNWYPSNNVNSWLVDDFKNKIPLINKLPAWYTRWGASNIQQPYSYKDKTLSIMPNIAKTYMGIKRDLQKAQTEKLVSWYVRKYPADFLQQLKWKERNSVRINKFKPKNNSLF